MAKCMIQWILCCYISFSFLRYGFVDGANHRFRTSFKKRYGVPIVHEPPPPSGGVPDPYYAIWSPIMGIPLWILVSMQYLLLKKTKERYFDFYRYEFSKKKPWGLLGYYINPQFNPFLYDEAPDDEYDQNNNIERRTGQQEIHDINSGKKSAEMMAYERWLHSMIKYNQNFSFISKVNRKIRQSKKQRERWRLEREQRLKESMGTSPTTPPSNNGYFGQSVYFPDETTDAGADLNPSNYPEVNSNVIHVPNGIEFDEIPNNIDDNFGLTRRMLNTAEHNGRKFPGRQPRKLSGWPKVKNKMWSALRRPFQRINRRY